MREWLVRSKLSPAITAREPLPRPRLLARLDRALDLRLTVLQAPAGYGKTSALAQWRDSLQARGIAAAWLSLDEHDGDPFQFLNYLVASCQAAGFTSGIELIDSPQAFSAPTPSVTAAALITALGRSAEPRVIILDDLHRAENPHICACLKQLLAGVPRTVHFVVSTRCAPSSLPMADLRAREELLMVREAEMKFSPQEIAAYFADIVPQPAPAGWPDALYEKTEGWPIALQTVRRWIVEGASIEETLAQISGRTSDLEDYFVEQVFDALNPDERRLLLYGSILERINGELGDLLCGTSDSWQLLEQFERRDLFVQRLDHERNWYRYHRLFSEFLKERLRRTEAAQLPRLHRLASRWFHARNQSAEAIQHAIAGEDPALLAEILEDLGGWRYALLGHLGTVERVLPLLTPEQLDNHPRTALADIYVKVRHGEPQMAHSAFQRLAQRLAENGGADPALQCEIRIMTSLLNRYTGSDATLAEVEPLEALGIGLPREDHLMHAVRCNLICAAHARLGRADECFAAGEQAIAHFRQMGSTYGEVFIYFHEGHACMVQGRMRDAEALFREGYDLAEEHFGADCDLAAVARTFLAEVAYEKNLTDEAAELLSTALPHIEQFDSWLEVYVAGYLTAVKLARLKRDARELADLARRMRSTASSRTLPDLRTIMDPWLRAFAYQDEELTTNISAPSVPEPPLPEIGPDEIFDPVLRTALVSAQARYLLRQQRPGDAQALLASESARAHRARHMRAFISHSVLLSVTHWRLQRHADACRALESAVAAAVFEGIKRPFIDAGPEVGAVLGELSRASRSGRANRLRDRFIAEVQLELRRAAATAPASQLLSTREREVLGHLAKGRSNGEIAAALSLSPNTVKFHIKNIFEKLSVGTREEAVTAALRKRLI